MAQTPPIIQDEVLTYQQDDSAAQVIVEFLAEMELLGLFGNQAAIEAEIGAGETIEAA